jgi:hypothetical protein
LDKACGLFDGFTLANFSYLLLSEREPAVSGPAANAPMRHIGTGRNHVPFAFKLLLSSEPRRVRDATSTAQKRFLLVSPREPGLARLRQFLQRIELSAAQPLVEQTLAFLDQPAQGLPYIVLNPWNIFDLGTEPHTQQFQALHDEIRNIDAAIDAQLAHIHTPLPSMTIEETNQPGFIARLLGARPKPPRVLPFPDPLYRLEELGLHSFHPDHRDRPAPV